jgi:hypothetical protein
MSVEGLPTIVHITSQRVVTFSVKEQKEFLDFATELWTASDRQSSIKADSGESPSSLVLEWLVSVVNAQEREHNAES